MSVLISFSAFANSEGPCPRDEALISLGWIQHSADELEDIWNQQSLESQGPHYVSDMSATYHSSQINDFVQFQSFDNLTTPQMEMFGDLALYQHHKTNEMLEVRWYAQGKKHFVHKMGVCTVDVVPIAENTLF